MSTLAFTVCFAVWTIFSIIGVRIKQELGLNGTQFGLLIGTPILTGSLIRVILGIWTDQYGGRLVYVAVMVSGAIATFLLSYAKTYEMMLIAALGVGIAGGSFAVGITYVSKWYPQEKQGTALGIFGAGNVGAAVTKFLAPFVLVAYGWQTVAQVWAGVLAIMAVLFWAFTSDDPELRARRTNRTQARGALLQLEPLKYQQVWRFSLYYFFVFGGFVALALWLPNYLVGVYGVDITTAGMLAATFSAAASLFRIQGGYLSDKYGARTVLYWTFAVAAVCLFMLSYPETQYVIHGIRGDISFSTRMDLVPFVIVIFVLGFFMSLGKAAVYKHIPVYYPHHVGAVGGLVGMIGGLGGFVLPIAFGVMNDLAGVWTACYLLMFALAVVSLIWMHFAVIRMERGAAGAAIETLPELPEFAGPQFAAAERKTRRPAQSATLEVWQPEDRAFWENTGSRIAQRNLWISIPCLLLAFAVWMVWSVVVAKLPAIGFAYTTDQLFWLAALPGLSGATLRIFYSFMVPIVGGRLWTTLSTASLLIPAFGIGYAVQNPDTPYLIFLVLALLCGFGGGNFASSMANISFFFPKSQKGNALALNAGLGNLGVSVMQFAHSAGRSRPASSAPSAANRRQLGETGAALAAERRLHLGAVHHRLDHRGVVRHERPRLGPRLLHRAGRHLRAQAQLDHVLAVHRHLRLVHRLFGGLSAAGQDAVPRLVDSLQYVFLGPLVGALSRAATGWIADRFGGARVTFWVFLVMIAAVLRRALLPRHQGPAGRVLGLLRHVHGAVLRDRRRQRLHLPDDPGDHAARKCDRLMPERGRRDAHCGRPRRKSAAIIGFTSAIAAYGAFFIPKAYGSSIALTGAPQAALWGFLGLLRDLRRSSPGSSTRAAAALLHRLERRANRRRGIRPPPQAWPNNRRLP